MHDEFEEESSVLLDFRLNSLTSRVEAILDHRSEKSGAEFGSRFDEWVSLICVVFWDNFVLGDFEGLQGVFIS